MKNLLKAAVSGPREFDPKRAAKTLKPKYRISVFRDRTKELARIQYTRQVWRWHLRSLIGKRPIVCTSGEPFDSRGNALRAARRMEKMLAVATEFDTED